jgi:NAD(P)-dependent dehydrogenase (short-subunit alcohol dehydrogenase family)
LRQLRPKDFGKVALVGVTNAGVEQEKIPIDALEEDEWARILTTDLRGVFLCLNASSSAPTSQVVPLEVYPLEMKEV